MIDVIFHIEYRPGLFIQNQILIINTYTANFETLNEQLYNMDINNRLTNY
jgi:hypothetical protein